MKDRLSALGGNLRWMSSERQIADGLTKESARLLLAQRLRHGRLKLVWDPSYKAAKKKTEEELQQSRLESVQEDPKIQPDMEHHEPPDGLEPCEPEGFEIKVDEHVSAEDQDTPNEQVHENVCPHRRHHCVCQP